MLDCINCTELAIKLNLPAFYSFTDCYYTTACYNKEKNKLLKIFLIRIGFQKIFALMTDL